MLPPEEHNIEPRSISSRMNEMEDFSEALDQTATDYWETTSFMRPAMSVGVPF